MKHLKIFLFIMIIFLNINVFATNTNVSNKTKYSTSSSKGTYGGDEIYLGGYNGQFTIGTRYNGRLAMVSFYISTSDYNFTTNHTYTITLNMATEDWRNNFMGPQVIEASSNGTLGSALSVSNFRFVSYKQIKFNFKTDGSLPTYLFFRLYSNDYANPNGGTTAITGVNNWNLSSIYINDNVSATPTPAPVTPAPTPTPQPNNQDIINNATQNTQDIINNQNNNTNSIIENNSSNTTDIIDNNNANTQNIIDNQNELLGSKCSNLFDFHYSNLLPYILNATKNDYYVVTGNTINLESGVTYYFSFKSNQPYGAGDTGVQALLLKDNNYNTFVSLSGLSGTFQVPSSGTYGLRLDCNENGATCTYYDFMISKTTSNFCAFGSYTSKLDDTTSAINDVNNTLNNDNVDSGVGSDFFSDFSDNSHGLTSIITSPLNAIQSITSSTCTPLILPIPFTNSNVTLPCMTQVYNERIPTIYNIWKVVSFGIIAYFICIDIFHIVKGFKDPESDKVEVVDL